MFSSHFYPRPPRGGRPYDVWLAAYRSKFLSTPSARRATLRLMHATARDTVFLSTPSARRATDYRYKPSYVTGISIHALREEGDKPSERKKVQQRNFYPRPPRGGRRGCCCINDAAPYFYPRPPRGGRHLSGVVQQHMFRFLSTPSARRATVYNHIENNVAIFLSTPSARRATGSGATITGASMDFYPRPPRGGRQEQSNKVSITTSFLSTPSARRATLECVLPTLPVIISIHALREEGDTC